MIVDPVDIVQKLKDTGATHAGEELKRALSAHCAMLGEPSRHLLERAEHGALIVRMLYPTRILAMSVNANESPLIRVITQALDRHASSALESRNFEGQDRATYSTSWDITVSGTDVQRINGKVTDGQPDEAEGFARALAVQCGLLPGVLE